MRQRRRIRNTARITAGPIMAIPSTIFGYALSLTKAPKANRARTPTSSVESHTIFVRRSMISSTHSGARDGSAVDAAGQGQLRLKLIRCRVSRLQKPPISCGVHALTGSNLRKGRMALGKGTAETVGNFPLVRPKPKPPMRTGASTSWFHALAPTGLPLATAMAPPSWPFARRRRASHRVFAVAGRGRRQ
jgi:hypothetical protein